MTKRKYHLLKAKDYNESLAKRGDIRLWVDENTLKSCYAKPEPGKHSLFQKIYSDDSIKCGLRLRALYQLPLRALQGFLSSLFLLSGITLNVPHFSTFSRRQKTLAYEWSCENKSDETNDIAIDATGIKVFGEGEWKARVHGYTYRRTWRKLHLDVDVDTH